ncbi:hypothetical protein P154DRAFT_619266 [Amniculicola lignicola CBS 123094]|uniref:Uncharacterized protein n=1 Tax=Amniculicola lignicola CBS 123094 TaxID=1392246 RepID=A0A6A5WKU0_9PLEO|nr:hypothetical protein P154DRAFT_619266 [Amniculicola lignicola CBS 123094]
MRARSIPIWRTRGQVLLPSGIAPALIEMPVREAVYQDFAAAFPPSLFHPTPVSQQRVLSRASSSSSSSPSLPPLILSLLSSRLCPLPSHSHSPPTTFCPLPLPLCLNHHTGSCIGFFGRCDLLEYRFPSITAVLRWHHGPNRLGTSTLPCPSLHMLITPPQILSVALLALGGAEARKDKIRISQWSTSDCSGHVSTKQIEPKSGDCKNIDARSVKFHAPKKGKHQKWVDDINSGEKKDCWVEAYREKNCKSHLESGEDWDLFRLPGGFGECEDLGEEYAIRSIKFECKNKEGRPSAMHHVYPVTEVKTSWSAAPGNSYSAGLYTTVYNSTLWYYPYPTATKGAHFQPSPSPEPRIAEPRVEPRAASKERHYNAKGVWLKSPFTDNELCFHCWTKDRENPGKFECQSPGPVQDLKGDQACGPAPSTNPAYWAYETHTLNFTKTLYIQPHTTVTISPPVVAYVVTTMTKYVVPAATPAEAVPRNANAAGFTLEDAALNPGLTYGDFEERSEKETVLLQHPFAAGIETCAKAKWKDAGERDQKIELEQKNCPKDKSKLQKIDAKHTHYAPPVFHWETVHQYDYEANTRTFTTQPTTTMTATATQVVTTITVHHAGEA